MEEVQQHRGGGRKGALQLPPVLPEILTMARREEDQLPHRPSSGCEPRARLRRQGAVPAQQPNPRCQGESHHLRGHALVQQVFLRRGDDVLRQPQLDQGEQQRPALLRRGDADLHPRQREGRGVEEHGLDRPDPEQGLPGVGRPLRDGHHARGGEGADFQTERRGLRRVLDHRRTHGHGRDDLLLPRCPQRRALAEDG